MTVRVASWIVFGASAGVLIVELAAVRLLAPYVGQSLETFTAIVTIVLAGISFGTWWGGRIADRTGDLVRLIGTELLIGGALTIAIVPLVALMGPATVGAGLAGLAGLAAVALFAPSAALSAVSPAVVRLCLSDLAETGATVGRFSAIGTAGAITGSVATGFYLVPLLGTTAIIVSTGALAALAGMAVAFRRPATALGIVATLAVGAGAAVAAGNQCDHETRYYCVQLLDDPTNPNGTRLVLDDLSHSYVDSADPTHLEFTYTRMLAAVVEAATEGPIDVTFLGGGAFTLPAWLDSERPGSTSTVLEIDPDLPEIVREELPPPAGVPTSLVIGDGRGSLRQLGTGSADIVIGDAFGGRAVPWHLTTEEFVADIERVLVAGGAYVANIIDGRDLDFTKAMAATLETSFDHVGVMTLPARWETGGNLVVYGSDREIDIDRIVAEAAALDLTIEVRTGDDLAAFLGDARILTDDHAPVDQLLG